MAQSSKEGAKKLDFEVDPTSALCCKEQEGTLCGTCLDSNEGVLFTGNFFDPWEFSDITYDELV